MTVEKGALLEQLSAAERYALLSFPELRDANPVRFQAAVTFGSLWRKFAKQWNSLVALEDRGIVERRVSRGETLWRPTKPLGLELAAALRALAQQGEG